MFSDIPQEILDQMRRLEAIDAGDRRDGTPRLQRLRQVPPEAGRFIALLAAGAPEGTWIEMGTSAGYSTLYLVLACREVGRKIVTFELLEEKADLARETFRLADVEDVVELIVGDARDYLPGYKNVSFCFIDAEKDVYLDCYEQVVENMVRGGLLLVDNAISHQRALQPTLERAESDQRVDSLVIPIGKGILVCRRV